MEGFRYLSDELLNAMKHEFEVMYEMKRESNTEWEKEYIIQKRKVCRKWIKSIDKTIEQRNKIRREVIK